MAAVRWRSLAFLLMTLFLSLHYLSFLLLDKIEKGETGASDSLPQTDLLNRPPPDPREEEHHQQSLQVQLLSGRDCLFFARICPALHQLFCLLPEPQFEGEKLPWKAKRNQGGGKLYLLASRKDPLCARFGPGGFSSVSCSQPWLRSKGQSPKVVDFQGWEKQLCEISSASEERERVEERGSSRA